MNKTNRIYQTITKTYQVLGDLTNKIFRKGADFSYWMSQEDAGFKQEQGGRYQPSPSWMIRRAFQRFDIKPSDQVIDIGCGKGWAMYCMSSLPFSAVRGIDLSEKLVTIANHNFSLLNASKCNSICADSTQFDGYDAYNYIYMFNPFPETIMEGCMKKIEESLIRKPRKVTIVYAHPVCHDYITKHTRFQFIGSKKFLVDWFDVNYYEYIPDVKIL